MRFAPFGWAFPLVLLLSSHAVAQAPAPELATVSDPASLGFSAARIARIAPWYQAQIDAGALPGAVVAISRNGKLAYQQAIGFEDLAKTVPMMRQLFRAYARRGAAAVLIEDKIWPRPLGREVEGDEGPAQVVRLGHRALHRLDPKRRSCHLSPPDP